MGRALKRVEDWVSRLDAYFESVKSRPFMWGEFDCCLFVAEACAAITGTHPVPDAAGAYKTKIGAYRWLRREFGGAGEMLTLLCGAPVDPNFARRGDVALIKAENGFALGIIDLSGEWIICVDETGLKRVEKWHASQFWAIG